MREEVNRDAFFVEYYIRSADGESVMKISLPVYKCRYHSTPAEGQRIFFYAPGRDRLSGLFYKHNHKKVDWSQSSWHWFSLADFL